MNRTQLAYGLAVFAAERIFRIVPEGAHDWNKFVTPEELTNFLRQSMLNTVLRSLKLINNHHEEAVDQDI